MNRPNLLAREKSPYLLQHAHNPVDWYPWGDAAFEKARQENKPILLSIGYSTCHWCHVMERESFENQKIADLMNRHFVCIKVDREERPDIDRIYMAAVQAMTGSGGWPLNAWLTPELKPFYGGTYFPPEDRWGRAGFPKILERVAELWEKERAKIDQSSAQIVEMLSQRLAVDRQGGEWNEQALESAYQEYFQSFDSERGGFSGAPKFPMPVHQNFLFRYYARTGNKQALEMALKTLREMAAGGIYDQIGGGFARYSTDDRWHIPHFEKMLYDNAQLAVNYLEAYQITRRPEFSRVARETLDYVRHDMTRPGGGFYSAEDADSLPARDSVAGASTGKVGKVEGAFYVWEKQEILGALGTETGERFCRVYGVQEKGNAESDPQGEFIHKNILYLAQPYDSALEGAREKLLGIRSQRPRPHRDDKILTAWNGLMISACARGAQVLNEPGYLDEAIHAALFIQSNLYDSDVKRLYRRWRDGERKIYATVDDYAFLVQGLIDLYEASLDRLWLDWAVQLMDEQIRLLWDEANGGFFVTAEDHDPNLIARTKEDQDNVEPAASSVAALNLLRLSEMLERKDFRELAEKTLKAYGEQMLQVSRSLPQMLCALDFALSKPRQIVIAGDLKTPQARALLQVVHERFLPVKVLVQKELPLIDGKPTAYVCHNWACERPTNDPQTLAESLTYNTPS